MDIISQILMIFFLIALSGLFSGAETSIFSSSKSKLYKYKIDGSKSATQLLNLLKNKEKLISVILLGNNFVNIAASTIATGLFIQLFGDNPQALLISTIFMTSLILIFAEVLPKTYAIRHSEQFAMSISNIFTFLTKILYPIAWIAEFVVGKILSLLLHVQKDNAANISGLDIIRGALEQHHAEGSVAGEDKYMIGGVIDLENIRVNEVMTHRNDILSFDIASPPEELVKDVIRSQFTRIPIWQGDRDNIIGILHARDLLNLLHDKHNKITNKDLQKIILKPSFILDSTAIKSQLQSFKENQSHLALIVDEYGELMGLITLEDIIEEIVGQIDDEYEHKTSKSPSISNNGDGSITVNGDFSIRDLNREMHWDIEDDEANSIGGLIFNLAKKVPNTGASFLSQGFKFKVVKKQKNKISRVNIKKI